MKDRQYSVKNSNEELNKITKSSLQTALIYLMNKKDFAEITITELVKKAGVSRMAFYRNYNSKEDILEKLKVEVINSLKVLFINLKECHGSYEAYYKIFEEIKLKEKEILLLKKANFKMLFLLENILLFDDMITSGDRSDYYNLVACIGAVLSIVTRWFALGMKESISYMASYCEKNIGVY